MIIILSQKIDSESSYSDELFNSYHYPAKYRNQLHKGDKFIYYQGNRYNKGQRYYFGIGTIGEILTTDGENYYAKLLDCQRFEKIVPIYLPDGGYIEQLGYKEVRNSINPPWQSSVRPLSQQAFDYILNVAGLQATPDTTKSVDVLKDKLKQAIRKFYIDGNNSAVLEIESISLAIAKSLNVIEAKAPKDDLPESAYKPYASSADRLFKFQNYCKTMNMSYSYKPVLILALLNAGKKDGSITISKAVKYFREYYAARRDQGLVVEKKRCIYLNPEVTDKNISANLIANPIRALTESSFFYFNGETQIFSISPDVWNAMDRKAKIAIGKICRKKLNDYYAG